MPAGVITRNYVTRNYVQNVIDSLDCVATPRRRPLPEPRRRGSPDQAPKTEDTAAKKSRLQEATRWRWKMELVYCLAMITLVLLCLGAIQLRLTVPGAPARCGAYSRTVCASALSEEGRSRVLRGNDRLGSQGVLSGFSWVLMSTHGFSVGSHGFSVGTQTVHFWVLRGFSGRHHPSVDSAQQALVVPKALAI